MRVGAACAPRARRARDDASIQQWQRGCLRHKLDCPRPCGSLARTELSDDKCPHRRGQLHCCTQELAQFLRIKQTSSY